MATPWFYAPDLTGESVQLADHEAHHLLRVRRLGPDDQVVLFDGRGTQTWGRIIVPARGKALVRITRRRWVEPPCPAVHLAVAMPKGQRQHWLVEKSSELGAAGLCPLLTARTVVKPDDWAAKQARWRRICIEACKQARRAHLPTIGDPVTLFEALRSGPRSGVVWLCHPWPDARPLAAAARETSPDRITLLIGPEGGFDETEVATALDQGAEIVRLGEQPLRTETAAVAALAALRLGT